MTDALHIFYDGDCRFCTASAKKWADACAKRGYVMTPLQSDLARSKLKLAAGEIPDEMKVETRSGKILGGIDGILYLMRRIWWSWPAGVIGKIPGIHALLVWRYKKFAAKRNCHNGACKIQL
jgi:predicted DCC family thiol-disulfide oxidoreductase YuxK